MTKLERETKLEEKMPLQKEIEGLPEGWSFHSRIGWWTGDLWAAVDDRLGKVNLREEPRKEEEYPPEPVREENCCRGGGSVPRKAECAKYNYFCPKYSTRAIPLSL